ncbi:hypothetical protein N7505_007247 [Penicillium chrysogenum]|jgi:hypothetical protein|uniref:Uncharacterized protein n=1 Tax=Penicillium chrysogenum TaxID=5076 RepID=A0ABQ8WD18_PENCH|nr:hypothetical protein N7524_011639 [Penicillium chrysogenum]KAJ5264454.1 hypothetical protein N7505_007247 [Penicillium chrysogenum]
MHPKEAEVLSALKLLCDTPREIIHLHRELAFETWRQVGTNLDIAWERFDAVTNERDVERAVTLSVGVTGPPRSSFRGDLSANPTDAIDLAVEGFHRTQRQRKRQRIEDDYPKDDHLTKILQMVQQRLPEMQAFSKRNTTLYGILQIEQHTQFTDKRVDHLKQIDGNKTPSDEQKLLRGLSQISLAQQFTNWEMEHGFKSKASMQYDAILKSSKLVRSRGNISRFIRNRRYPPSDESVVSKGIQRGIVQMVFSGLLQNVLKDTEFENNIQGIMALVTIFHYSLFQALKISELPAFINLLLGECKEKDTAATMRGNGLSKSVIASVGDFSKWFRDISSDFELISSSCHSTRHREPRQNQSEVGQPLTTIFHDLAQFAVYPKRATGAQDTGSGVAQQFAGPEFGPHIVTSYV